MHFKLQLFIQLKDWVVDYFIWRCPLPPWHTLDRTVNVKGEQQAYPIVPSQGQIQAFRGVSQVMCGDN